jgi:hypothetical protein
MTHKALGFDARPPGRFGNTIATWSPTNGTEPGTAEGWSLQSSGPTVEHPELDYGDLNQQVRRTQWTSAATANVAAGLRSAHTTCWRGNSARLGGFCFSARFSLAANFSGVRAFVGLASSGDALEDDPSELTNCIGIGFDHDDATGCWYLISRDDDAGARMLVLDGVEWPSAAPRNTTDVYDLTIYAKPNADSIGVRFVNVSSGDVVLNDIELATAIPLPAEFLHVHAQVGTDTAVAAAIAIAGLSLETAHGANPVKTLGRDGTFNVRDFGAVGDGVTDDLPAFKAALEAMGSAIAAERTGARLFVPPVSEPGEGAREGYYFLNGNLDITREIVLEGAAGGGGNTATKIRFPEFCGIVIHTEGEADDGGDGGYTKLRYLNLYQLDVGGSELAPPAAWVAGEHVAGPPPSRVLPERNHRYYYECIVGGNSAAMTPIDVWELKTEYEVDDLVRPFEQNGHVYRCTTPGTSGLKEPAWTPGAASRVDDNGITWTEDSATTGLDNEPLWEQAYVPDDSVPYNDGGVDYRFGDVVRVPLPGAPNRGLGVFFRCVSTGVQTSAGLLATAFDRTPGALTKDGDVKWEAFASGAYANPWTATAGTPGPAPAVGEVVTPTDRTIRAFFICTASNGATGDEPSWKLPKPLDPNPVVTIDSGGNEWTWHEQGGRVIWDGDPMDGCLWACRVSAGVYLKARATLEHCFIRNFLNAGVHIEAGDAASNANGFRLDTLAIWHCGCGVVVRGGDTNAGVGIAIDVTGRGESRAELGIEDGSFLGCTWLGCQVAAVPGTAYSAGIVSAAYSTFIGMYKEADSGPVKIGGSAQAFGGDIGEVEFIGVAPSLTPYGNRNISETTASHGPGITLTGYLIPDGVSAIGFASADDTHYYRHQYGQPEAGWWSLNHGASSANTAMAYSGTNAAEGPGKAWAYNGIFLGNPKTLVINGTEPPSSGTWKQGDVVMNNAPTAGGFAGWICIDSGTQSQLLGIQTAASVNELATTVLLNNVEGLVPGQYIKIGDQPDAYKIVKVTVATIDINPPGVQDKDGIPAGAAIALADGTPLDVQTSKFVSEHGTTVTLNKVDGLMEGQDITIGKAPHVYTIKNVTPPAIDITPGAKHAVVDVGKAIAFSPARFSTFGEVANIGNSSAYKVDTLLKFEDRYVTVTATASMTLPKSPVDGQTHEIKSRPGVTTNVETEDAEPPLQKLKIDGQESFTIAPGSSSRFRYSAAIGEWEIR